MLQLAARTAAPHWHCLLEPLVLGWRGAVTGCDTFLPSLLLFNRRGTGPVVPFSV